MMVADPGAGKQKLQVFRGKHATNGLRAQLESPARLLIASIISSQIKMSNSVKTAVPLCSLIIRGSVFLFSIRKNSCLVSLCRCFLKRTSSDSEEEEEEEEMN